MTRRQLCRRAFDAEHKKRLLRHHIAESGSKTKAAKDVKAYVTKLLEEARDAAPKA